MDGIDRDSRVMNRTILHRLELTASFLLHCALPWFLDRPGDVVVGSLFLVIATQHGISTLLRSDHANVDWSAETGAAPDSQK